MNLTMSSSQNSGVWDDGSTAKTSSAWEAHQKSSLIGVSMRCDDSATNNSSRTGLVSWIESWSDLTAIPESWHVGDRNDFRPVDFDPVVFSESWDSQHGEQSSNDKFHLDQKLKSYLMLCFKKHHFYTFTFLSPTLLIYVYICVYQRLFLSFKSFKLKRFGDLGFPARNSKSFQRIIIFF